MYTVIFHDRNLEDVKFEYIHNALEHIGNEEVQIKSPEWGMGYVSTYGKHPSSPKYFPGHDEHGFGGNIPQDAEDFAARLDIMREFGFNE